MQVDLWRVTRVVRIQRVRLANDVPISFDETYLPREIGEKIIENDLEPNHFFRTDVGGA